MNKLLNKSLKKISIIKQNDLFGKSIYNLFIQVIGLGLSYLVVYLITHKYNADILGYYTLASVLLQLCTIIVLFGVNTATVQLVPGLRLKNDTTSINSILLKGMVQVLVIGLFATLLLYFTSGIIATYAMHKPKLTAVYQITSFAIIPSAIITYLGDFLRGNGKNSQWAIINRIFVFFIFIILFITASYIIKEPDPIEINVIANFMAMVVTVIMLLVFVKKRKLNIKLRDIYHSPSFTAISKLSFPMFLFSSTLLLSGWITTLMIGSLGTTTDTGIYRVIDRVSSISILILTAVNAVLAPKIAAAFSNKDMQLLKNNVLFATKLIFWLSLPIQLGLICFHSFILKIFGHEFLYGNTGLIIILIGQIVNSLAGPCGQILNMTHHQVFLRNVSFLSLIIMVVINYFLIPPYGITGAAISSLIGNIFINVVCVVKIKKEFEFSALYIPFYSDRKYK